MNTLIQESILIKLNKYIHKGKKTMKADGRQVRSRSYMNKRVCGLWLIWVAAILFAGLLAGERS